MPLNNKTAMPPLLEMMKRWADAYATVGAYIVFVERDGRPGCPDEEGYSFSLVHKGGVVVDSYISPDGWPTVEEALEHGRKAAQRRSERER